MEASLQLLISIAAPEEIARALAGGAQVLDVKDPLLGSLGAAGERLVRAARAAAGDVPVSAALGDSPHAWDTGADLGHAACTLASAGASLLKLGLAGVRPPYASALMCELVARLAGQNEPAALVAVAFADAGPEDVAPPELPDLAAAAGLRGAMLDTLRKGPSLLELLGREALAEWIRAVKRRGLLCGIAGSLTIEDAATVAALGPDVVGLRGAVCEGGRTGSLRAALVRRARHSLAACEPAARPADLVGAEEVSGPFPGSGLGIDGGRPPRGRVAPGDRSEPLEALTWK